MRIVYARDPHSLAGVVYIVTETGRRYRLYDPPGVYESEIFTSFWWRA